MFRGAAYRQGFWPATRDREGLTQIPAFPKLTGIPQAPIFPRWKTAKRPIGKEMAKAPGESP